MRLNTNMTSNKAVELKKLFDKSIDEIDDSLGYKDLAKAVALVLEENYGSHNYVAFVEELKKNLEM